MMFTLAPGAAGPASRCTSIAFALVCAALALLMPRFAAHAQAPADTAAQREASVTAGFLPSDYTVLPFYAGRYEPRIGGSAEPADSKLRLDIGASADLYRWDIDPAGAPVPTRISVGADFFTWTRLRSTASFKFPVEAVDYYFGVNAAAQWNSGMVARLRLAHISAHIVDGDSSFTSPQARYFTYSREFADAMIAIGSIRPKDFRHTAFGMRLYAGTLAMFHTIPDTLGLVTPYLGIDVSTLTPHRDIGMRIGYELRLNTELEVILEHQARAGIKFGRLDGRGVLLEVMYFSGRSQYGQHFGRSERYGSLGFAVDF